MEQDTLLEEIDFDQQQEEQQHYHGEDIHSDESESNDNNENILNESTSNDNQEEIVNSDEQGQDEALCRICKQPAADDDPLFHPCKVCFKYIIY